MIPKPTPYEELHGKIIEYMNTVITVDKAYYNVAKEGMKPSVIIIGHGPGGRWYRVEIDEDKLVIVS